MQLILFVLCLSMVGRDSNSSDSFREARAGRAGANGTGVLGKYVWRLQSRCEIQLLWPMQRLAGGGTRDSGHARWDQGRGSTHVRVRKAAL